MGKQTQMLQGVLAAMLLTVGLLVYLFDRPADQIYFIPDGWEFADDTRLIFGSIGAHLPTFIHVLAFILISSALLAPWCLRIVDIVSGRFQGVPFLENTSRYFLAGMFDFLDLVSSAVGSVTACLMISYFQLWESDYDAKQ